MAFKVHILKTINDDIEPPQSYFLMMMAPLTDQFIIFLILIDRMNNLSRKILMNDNFTHYLLLYTFTLN